jgi:hypothetical protein
MGRAKIFLALKAGLRNFLRAGLRDFSRVFDRGDPIAF